MSLDFVQNQVGGPFHITYYYYYAHRVKSRNCRARVLAEILALDRHPARAMLFFIDRTVKRIVAFTLERSRKKLLFTMPTSVCLTHRPTRNQKWIGKCKTGGLLFYQSS